MRISHVTLRNWRNFKDVDVELGRRVFLVGPNACGKSNFLDAFRFLRDLAKPGGGLQESVSRRGGLKKLRCLAARRSSDVELKVHLADGDGDESVWEYELAITQERRGRETRPRIRHERVYHGRKIILDRPDKQDKKDKTRLTQTHLEQVNANEKFRPMARAFQSIRYLHLVPQMVRQPGEARANGDREDPFGRGFLEEIGATNKRTRVARLNQIQSALAEMVPQFQTIEWLRDERGVPHLETLYQHWRPTGAKQQEDQFSDGTIRLIGLLWALLDGDSPLLLEEPELSLHSAIVRKLPALVHRLQRKNKRQVIMSSHSTELFSDLGIGGEEILLMTPTQEKGTLVRRALEIEEIRHLLESGMTPADAVIPYTNPAGSEQLVLPAL